MTHFCDAVTASCLARDFLLALTFVCVCVKDADGTASVVNVIFGMSMFTSSLFGMLHACLSSSASQCHLCKDL